MKTTKSIASKPLTLRSVPAAILAAALLLATGSHPARANHIRYFRTAYDTDFTSAGVGSMRDVGSGCIVLSGVTGVVNRAFLYWAGPMNTLNPSANAVVTVNSQTVVGVIVGISQDNCWGYLVSQAYRADVTALVQTRRNGKYNLSGFHKNPDNVNINVNGASLIVFFQDGSTNNNRDVVLFDGNDSNAPSPRDTDGWEVELDNILYRPGPVARMQLHASDGQIYAESALIINGVTVVPRGPVFSGDTVPGADNGPGGLGRLWDIRNFDLTGFLSPTTNRVQMTMGYTNGDDCVDLVVASISLPVGSIAPPTNLPPTLACTNLITVTNSNPIIVPAFVQDSDGDALSYLILTNGIINRTGMIPAAGPPNTATLTLTNSFGLGMHVVTFTVSDTFASASCAVAINVIDTNGPIINCSGNLTATTLPGTNYAVVIYAVTASDNFPGVISMCLPPSGSRFLKGTNTVNCTAVDVAGNRSTCSFLVTVADVIPPLSFDCPMMIDYSNFLATNFPGITLTCIPTNNSFFPVGTNLVNCTYTNALGQLTNFSFAVTIVDTNPPSLQCPSNILVIVAPGVSNAVVTYSATASDCSAVTLFYSKASGTSFPLGVTTVTVTARDASFNSNTCAFTVSVANNNLSLSVSNLVRNTDPGVCSAVVAYPFAKPPPGQTTLCQPPSGASFPKGVSTVQCTATNLAGRSTNASFSVTIFDKEKPTLICPTNLTIGCPAGLTNGLVSWNTTSADNCPGVRVVCDPPSGSLFGKGTNNVVCTATDTSANSTNCTFQVRVISR